jgi:hypothetical protein
MAERSGAEVHGNGTLRWRVEQLERGQQELLGMLAEIREAVQEIRLQLASSHPTRQELGRLVSQEELRLALADLRAAVSWSGRLLLGLATAAATATTVGVVGFLTGHLR